MSFIDNSAFGMFEIFGLLETSLRVLFFSFVLCTCEDIPLFLSGETGIGKSTLIDTLFNTNFEDHGSSHFYPHVRLEAQTYELHESNVRLKLTIVNTVGFGDQINKEERYTFSCCNCFISRRLSCPMSRDLVFYNGNSYLFLSEFNFLK